MTADLHRKLSTNNSVLSNVQLLLLVYKVKLIIVETKKVNVGIQNTLFGMVIYHKLQGSAE